MVMYLVVEIVLVHCRIAFVVFAHMCCCRMYRTVVHILTFAFFVVFDGVGFGPVMFSVGVGKGAGYVCLFVGQVCRCCAAMRFVLLCCAAAARYCISGYVIGTLWRIQNRTMAAGCQKFPTYGYVVKAGEKLRMFTEQGDFWFTARLVVVQYSIHFMSDGEAKHL
jgi:hypothetical protein